jgi:hypothetical protein
MGDRGAHGLFLHMKSAAKRGPLYEVAIETPYLRRVLFVWCRMIHRAHHTNFWTEYSKRFFRCDKCGHHFANKRN